MQKWKDSTMTAPQTLSPDTMPFEEALQELEEIVKRLERGDVPLDESIAIYERGEVLRKRCENLLRIAEERIEKISVSADGCAEKTEPLDISTSQ